jgi:hypothetical protein
VQWWYKPILSPHLATSIQRVAPILAEAVCTISPSFTYSISIPYSITKNLTINRNRRLLVSVADFAYRNPARCVPCNLLQSHLSACDAMFTSAVHCEVRRLGLSIDAWCIQNDVHKGDPSWRSPWLMKSAMRHSTVSRYSTWDGYFKLSRSAWPSSVLVGVTVSWNYMGFYDTNL